MSEEAPVDVLVVGSGLAGLLTAYRLQQAGKTVKVLEGRSRIGGRMTGQTVGPDSAYIDMGGQWVGPTQTRMLDLLKELGIEKFNYKSGLTRLEYNGKRCDYAGDMYFAMLPAGSSGTPDGLSTPEEQEDARQAWRKMEEIMAGFEEGSLPFEHKDAVALDSQTLYSWLQQNTKTDFAKFFFEVACASLGQLGPGCTSGISPLHFCWSQHMSPQGEFPESYLIHGGAGQIPPILVDKIGAEKVLVDQDVVNIRYDGKLAKARTLQGATFTAKCVVVACPPSVACAIIYDPPLTAQRHQLMQRFPMGTIAKVLVAYERPFWDDDKIIMCISMKAKYVEFTADASDPSKKTGIIAAFIQGKKYFEWKTMSLEDRKAAVLNDLEYLYSRKEMQKPIAMEIGDWPKDQFAGGGYAGTVGPGVWTTYGPGNRNVEWDGRLDFCGTEYATRWAGFFEGAADSAYDVIGRVSKLTL